MDDRWQVVEQLFADALALEPGVREAFVARACGGDELARREVLTLLRADVAAGRDYLRHLVADAVGRFCREADTSRLGQQVGPYHLVAELGRGGMGRVYLAERTDRQYRAQVAIKFMQGGFASPELIARFRTERQILADLAHPNIARLLDGGSTADGTPFLVMERIDGRPIDRYCDRQGLDLRPRLELFLRVAGAVQHAHQALIVHRDLKPSNILVTADGQPKLLDFGIARLLDPVDGEAETTVLRALTPSYASPEQVRGARATVATDVYSLGVLLYRLVVGREPFRLHRLSPGEVERVLAEQEPQRPSQALARMPGRPESSWRSRVRGDLDTILLRALGKTPEERYPSVAALAEDLRRHLDGLPVLARPATLAYRAGKFLRRYRREVLIASAALVTMVALTGWYLGRVATARDRARSEAAKAAEVAGFLQQLFEVSDPGQARGESITARELLDRGASRIRTELAGQPEVQAAMLRVVGSVYGSLGLSDAARPLLEQALDLERRLHPGPDPETAAAAIALAVVLQDLGDLNRAEPLFREALATRTRLHGRNHRSVTEAQEHLAFLLETRGNAVAAESLLVAALQVNRRLFPAGDPVVTHTLVRLGGLLRRTGQPERAEPLLREGLAAERAALGEQNLDVASTERNLAALLRDQGRFVEAESLYRQVLTTRRALLGDSHPEVATALNSYALLLQRKGDPAGAVAVFREFAELLGRIYHAPHPSLAAAYNNLGYAQLELHRLDDARSSFERARTIQDQVLPPGHLHRSHTLVGLALVGMNQHRSAEAEPLLRRAVAIRRMALPPGHRELGEALRELGVCLTSLRRYPAAESALTEGYRILEASRGPDATATRRARQALVTLYDLWDRPDQAARYRLPVPGSGPGG